ncbi:MAG: hypothetical protein ABFS86_00260 [Planctomycetota bacterium]
MDPGSRGAGLAPIGGGPYSVVLRARSGVGDVALKIQKEISPDPNPATEARWAREYAALSRFGGEEPGLLGIEPIPGFEGGFEGGTGDSTGDDREPPRFEPLFLCREKALLFHLPCPRSMRMHVLGDCRDDSALTANGLPAWSKSTERYLWSTHFGADDPVFYARKHRGGPGPVKDFVELIRDLRTVVDRGSDEDPIPSELLDALELEFPCMTCEHRAECHPRPGAPEQGRAEVRIFPVSMYEFHAWPVPLCSLAFDEAADFLSGTPAAELVRTHGKTWKNTAVRRMKEAAFATGAPETPLLALAAKLDVFAQAVQSVQRLHEEGGHPHLGLSPAHLLVQPEEGQTPMVRLAAPDAGRRMGALHLPPPEPVAPYAAPALLDERFGREFSVRVHVGKVWAGTGDTFFSAEIKGENLPLDIVGEDDLILLQFTDDGWEDIEILGNRISDDALGGAGGSLNLVTTPKKLDVTQTNDLKDAKGGKPLFGTIRVLRDFGIPFDIHAMGILLFRTFLTNQGQSFERVMEEIVLPVVGSLSLFSANRPDAGDEEFVETLRGFLREEPVASVARPANVWHEPGAADVSRVPEDAWTDLLTVGFRAVTLIPGFSYFESDREDLGDETGAPALDFLTDLEAVSEVVARAVLSDTSAPIQVDEVPSVRPLSDTEVRSITSDVSKDLEKDLQRLRDELEESERARHAMEQIWASLYESVVGVKDTGRAPKESEDGRVTLLATTASESIECVTQVFKMFARLSGDELGENVPKIRILIQDALREVKDGTAEAGARAKKIRRQLKAIRVALFGTMQSFVEANTHSTKAGTKVLFDLMEKGLFEPVVKGRKERDPDFEEVRRRFSKLKEQMPGKHQRIFQPYFQEALRTKLAGLK